MDDESPKTSNARKKTLNNSELLEEFTSPETDFDVMSGQESRTGPFGQMLSRPGKLEQSDILLQEIGRLSEQQRREASARLLGATNFQQPTELISTQTATNSTSGIISSSQDFELQSGFDTNQLTSQIAATQTSQSSATLSAILPPELAINTLQFYRNHDLSYPMMLQRDNNTSYITMFPIGNHKIVGFIVGGEPRLCLPHFKSSILPELEDLDSILSGLGISTVNASIGQVSQLIQANALPKALTVCPLISRSNAEKFINHCVINGIRPLHGLGEMDKFMQSEIRQQLEGEILKIEHFCFGGQPGRYFPSLLGGACIECPDCNRLFEPPGFVRHAHHMEQETSCDWGFDSENWNFYIGLHPEQTHTEEAEFLLRQLLATTYVSTSALESAEARRSTFSLMAQQTLQPCFQNMDCTFQTPQEGVVQLPPPTSSFRNILRRHNNSTTSYNSAADEPSTSEFMSPTKKPRAST